MEILGNSILMERNVKDLNVQIFKKMATLSNITWRPVCLCTAHTAVKDTPPIRTYSASIYMLKTNSNKHLAPPLSKTV